MQHDQKQENENGNKMNSVHGLVADKMNIDMPNGVMNWNFYINM